MRKINEKNARQYRKDEGRLFYIQGLIMKKELLKKVVAKIKKEAFNKENPTELMSQLIKVIKRDFHDPKVDEVVRELKNVSTEVFKLKK